MPISGQVKKVTKMGSMNEVQRNKQEQQNITQCSRILKSKAHGKFHGTIPSK